MDIVKVPYMRLIPCFVVFLILIGCTHKIAEPTVYTDLAMGTVVEISLWEQGEISQKAFNEIKRIENEFSIFNSATNISRLNAAGRFHVSDECLFLIKKSLEYRKITDGAFDITKQGKDIIISGNTILLQKGAKLDFGGIAKGYAVDRVAEIFRENNVKNVMINLGGNLFLIGYPPRGKKWTVGIKNPSNPSELVGKILLSGNIAVATSGNYERPGHIINPITKQTVHEVLSVTVTAHTATEADALSTGVFVLGKEKGLKLIENLENVEAVIIDKNGIWCSSGLRDKFTLLK